MQGKKVKTLKQTKKEEDVEDEDDEEEEQVISIHDISTCFQTLAMYVLTCSSAPAQSQRVTALSNVIHIFIYDPILM